MPLVFNERLMKLDNETGRKIVKLVAVKEGK